MNWSYLRLILFQIGLSPDIVKWIMSCVSSSRFVVLINGVPLAFFKGNRGIHQGCPLYPYLFILAIEGLSLLIHHAKLQNKFYGIMVPRGLFVTHLLFVDDLVIIGGGSQEEWNHL